MTSLTAEGALAFHVPTEAATARTLDVPSYRTHGAISMILAGDLLAIAATAALLSPRSPAAWTVAVALFGSLVLGDGYHLHLNLSILDHVPWLGRRVTLAMLVCVPVLVKAQQPGHLLAFIAACTLALISTRAATYGAVRSLRRRRSFAEPALVVGSGERANSFVDLVEAHPEYGLWVVGLIGDHHDDTKVVGTIDELAGLVDALDIKRVVITPDVEADNGLVSALRGVLDQRVKVHIVPRLTPLVPAPHEGHIDVLQSVTLHELRSATSSPALVVKRLIDIVCSSVLLLATLPLLAVCALGVKLSSRGPLLFRQQRVGKHGRTFTMYKFRTFPADHVYEQFSQNDSPLRWGRLLRCTSMDELPQLWNVLVGDMSIIGPRPECPQWVDTFSQQIPGYGDRHRFVGGITGLAQVAGLWGDSSIEDRVALDNRYIDNWSLWGDFVIAVRTIPALIRKTRGHAPV